jgi:hypothetical protein
MSAAMTDPFTVRVRVFPGDDLGDAMSKLRRWLDGEKIQLSTFRTGIDARGYTFDVGFRTVDDLKRFRAQFPTPDAGP